MKVPNSYQLIIQNAIFGNMERFYLWLGEKVAQHPLWVILGSIVFAVLCSSGVFLIESETEELQLWIPVNSDFYVNSEWISLNIPSKTRAQQFIIVTENDENILTKANLYLLNDIMRNISKLR
jgi:hypothetical protein